MCRHIYDWIIVDCDVKQPIHLTSPYTSDRVFFATNSDHTQKQLETAYKLSYQQYNCCRRFNRGCQNDNIARRRQPYVNSNNKQTLWLKSHSPGHRSRGFKSRIRPPYPQRVVKGVFVKSRSNFKVTRSKINYSKNILINGTHGKVLSQGMCICHMKALPHLVRKLWPRLKVLFESRSNFKV